MAFKMKEWSGYTNSHMKMSPVTSKVAKASKLQEKIKDTWDKTKGKVKDYFKGWNPITGVEKKKTTHDFGGIQTKKD